MDRPVSAIANRFRPHCRLAKPLWVAVFAVAILLTQAASAQSNLPSCEQSAQVGPWTANHDGAIFGASQSIGDPEFVMVTAQTFFPGEFNFVVVAEADKIEAWLGKEYLGAIASFFALELESSVGAERALAALRKGHDITLVLHESGREKQRLVRGEGLETTLTLMDALGKRSRDLQDSGACQ